MAALAILSALGALASIVSGLKNIFDDTHTVLDEKLDEVLTELQQEQKELIQSTAQILEAIDGIKRLINENTALDNITLADVALFNDLAQFNNKEEAGAHSLQAADRLFRVDDVVFAGPFMYVVSIRLAVMKDFNPRGYFCNELFRREFLGIPDTTKGYIGHFNDWIAQINNMIIQSNTVDVSVVEEENARGVVVERHWEATYSDHGMVVQTFEGPRGNLSERARARVEAQANDARAAGIETDRQQFGVVDMEKAAAAWEQAFTNPQRTALVSQVLNRPTMAIDFNPDGLMVDGQILPVSHDLSTTLMGLLISREFRNRVQKAWDAFMNRSDDRLVQFAHHRLFNRYATSDEIASLRGIASNYGYVAFIAALLYSKEYKERYGSGLPIGGQPIIDALKVEE